MVCPRCVMAVRTVLENNGCTIEAIDLGEATVTQDVSHSTINTIKSQLEDIGFQLLDDPRSALVEKIRTQVIEWVRLKGEHPRLSSFIQDNINKDYSYLSKLFSEVRGMTIERYCILQRIELAKEQLCYSEKSASEIAYQMGYSSLAHFSAQFKQITGMSPKEFKQINDHVKLSHRRFLDEI